MTFEQALASTVELAPSLERHAWLVDPEARTLEVLRLETGRWVLATQHADQELVRAEPFAAAEIDLARWWLPEA